VSAQQQLVGAAGLGLVVANAWTGQQRHDLAAILGSGDGGDVAAAHAAARAVGVELLGVGALVLLAGSAGAAGNAAFAIIAALWLVWLMRRHGTTTGAGVGATAAARFTPHPTR
jgi:hypothetical protein